MQQGPTTHKDGQKNRGQTGQRPSGPIQQLSGQGRAPQTGPSASGAPPIPLQVFLTSSPDEVSCRFWIGLAQKGKSSPRQLLDLPDVKSVFDRASASGIEEQPPLMISDSSTNPVRYFFILGAPEPSEPDRIAWVKSIVDALKSWSPEQAGFVLDPELLELPTARELLVQVLVSAAKLPHTRQYFFSVEKHGFNAGLNAMLMLKRELEDRGIKVHVFH